MSLPPISPIPLDTPPVRNQVSLLITLAFVAMLIVGGIIALVAVRNAGTPSNNTVAVFDASLQYDGITTLDTPQPIADFTLTNQAGDALPFSQYQGQTVLLYFGYASCPDFCPTTLSDFKQIKARLGAQADAITFMMISVDGARDTPQVLANYLGRIDPAFVGLTGTAEEVSAATEQFGVIFEANPLSDAGYYLVDHTVSLFLVDAAGQYTTYYAYGTDVEVIIADLAGKLG
ncbi:MAG: SCO family protein [Armatimonadetes bacterium]|nr:SCO family protein [Anaerolineae bacterium]